MKNRKITLWCFTLGRHKSVMPPIWFGCCFLTNKAKSPCLSPPPCFQQKCWRIFSDLLVPRFSSCSHPVLFGCLSDLTTLPEWTSIWAFQTLLKLSPSSSLEPETWLNIGSSGNYLPASVLLTSLVQPHIAHGISGFLLPLGSCQWPWTTRQLQHRPWPLCLSLQYCCKETV